MSDYAAQLFAQATPAPSAQTGYGTQLAQVATPAVQPQPPNMTSAYNTPLSPSDEAQFQAWITQTGRQNDLADYDLRGAWKEGAQQAANGHFTDKFKKPNHPTFSNESIYSGQNGYVGGEWQKQGKGWIYKASPTNLKMRTPEQLQQYFQQREPDSVLMLPQ